MKFRITVEAEVSETHIAKHGLTPDKLRREMQELTAGMIGDGDVQDVAITITLGDETFSAAASAVKEAA